MSGTNSYSASIASMGFFQNGGIVRAFSSFSIASLTRLSVSGGSVATVPQKALAFLRVFALWDNVFLQRIRFFQPRRRTGAGTRLWLLYSAIVYRCASDLCSPFGGTWLGCFQKHGWIGMGLALGLVCASASGWLMSLTSGRRRRGMWVTRDGLYVILLYE